MLPRVRQHVVSALVQKKYHESGSWVRGFQWETSTVLICDIKKKERTVFTGHICFKVIENCCWITKPRQHVFCPHIDLKSSALAANYRGQCRSIRNFHFKSDFLIRCMILLGCVATSVTFGALWEQNMKVCGLFCLLKWFCVKIFSQVFVRNGSSFSIDTLGLKKKGLRLLSRYHGYKGVMMYPTH